MQCPACGKANKKKVDVCKYCGEPMNEDSDVVTVQTVTPAGSDRKPRRGRLALALFVLLVLAGGGVAGLIVAGIEPFPTWAAQVQQFWTGTGKAGR
ncbi:MAG: hypothetical protein AB7S36_22870 [Planctomycetota bacterium]